MSHRKLNLTNIKFEVSLLKSNTAYQNTTSETITCCENQIHSVNHSYQESQLEHQANVSRKQLTIIQRLIIEKSGTVNNNPASNRKQPRNLPVIQYLITEKLETYQNNTV